MFHWHCLFIVLKIPLSSMPSSHDPVICLFIVLKILLGSPCHPIVIQWSQCSIVFSLFWKSHCPPCHPVWRSSDLPFHCFENPTRFSMPSSRDPLIRIQNVPLSFHCFENPTVLTSSCHPITNLDFLFPSYGDLVPQSVQGKIVGAVCSFSGIFLIALMAPLLQKG
jgi:hypothetical protein